MKPKGTKMLPHQNCQVPTPDKVNRKLEWLMREAEKRQSEADVLARRQLSKLREMAQNQLLQTGSNQVN